MIVTQTFPPRTGGMQNVMDSISKRLSINNEIHIFPDHYLAKDYKNSSWISTGTYIKIDLKKPLFWAAFYGLIFSLVWLVTAVVSKYSSLSALVASLSILIIVYLENDNIFLMVLLMVTMIFLKHISNIRRLLKGNELRINLKK